MAGLLTKIMGTKETQVLEVDPTFLAARVAMRPLEYVANGRILGHYAVEHRSGELAATIGALGHLASLRWSDSTAFCVLTRIKVGYSISAAVTTAVQMNMRAVLARGFSVDFSTARTLSNLAAVPKANAMRSSMNGSLMGVNGPAISTTTVMSSQTLTADTDGFAFTNWPALLGTNGTGTAVALPVGMAGEMQTLYECTSPYQHPIVLSQNEGVIIQPITAGPARGSFSIYVQRDRAEVVVF